MSDLRSLNVCETNVTEHEFAHKIYKVKVYFVRKNNIVVYQI
jgi:hypothetical protein